MSIGSLHEWTVDNIWVLVLLAMSFRIEAVFYRALREYFRRSGDDSSVTQVIQKQENAMFELSSIIQRASLHQVIGLCPLSLYHPLPSFPSSKIVSDADPVAFSA